jgi:uncharacterized membrane protein YhaH (DUF805 family)
MGDKPHWGFNKRERFMNTQTFTSFEGRIGRQTFWLGTLSLFILQWVLFALFGGVGMMGTDMADPAAAEAAMSGMMWPMTILFLVFLWPSLAIAAKRFHERDKSAWWILIVVVPIIGGLWYLIECGFLRGTDGPNRFGEDPVAD